MDCTSLCPAQRWRTRRRLNRSDHWSWDDYDRGRMDAEADAALEQLSAMPRSERASSAVEYDLVQFARAAIDVGETLMVRAKSVRKFEWLWLVFSIPRQAGGPARLRRGAGSPSLALTRSSPLVRYSLHPRPARLAPARPPARAERQRAI